MTTRRSAGVPTLAGLRAVVTGASSGIGAEIARACARDGADVLITYHRSARAARDVVSEMTSSGVSAWALQADVGTRAGCEALIAETTRVLGRIDVWINNAGVDVLTGEAAGWSPERKLDALLDVDLRGTIRCSGGVARLMRDQPGGGTIVNIGWDHAVVGMEGEDAELFSAVKAAVLGYSKSLARSLAPDVRVNVLCPGWIETRVRSGRGPRLPHEEVAAGTPLEDVGAGPRTSRPRRCGWRRSAAAFVTGQSGQRQRRGGHR